ncbi:MAG TPA: DUF1772 domain-containing protein [Candidatus Binatia bacterium]|nr:DUF1772 domain-containing protein [Candidatus Binatia bacterium]
MPRPTGVAAAVRRAVLACALVDLAALLAHVLELPNKLGLPGPLWLAVQQRLYRGWGPVLGPFEVAALAGAWLLAALVGRRSPAFARMLLAALCLTAALALFFAVVRPVNLALAGWTPATLPADWPRWRLRWEVGHAARAALVLVAVGALASGPARVPPPARR